MLKYLTLLLFLATFLTSCSKNNPVSPGASAWIDPKAGSSFTFDNYSTDTTTGLPVPGTRDTTVDTFLQSGISYMGKTNVSEIVQVGKFTRDTVYLNYESNGDISEFIPSGNGSLKWFTIPSGSKTTSTALIANDTTTYGSIIYSTKVTETFSYVDDETMSIKGQSVSVTKLQASIISSLTTTPPGTTTTSTSASFGYFSPTLGYITKSEDLISTDPTTGTKSQGHLMLLIDYTEK